MSIYFRNIKKWNSNISFFPTFVLLSRGKTGQVWTVLVLMRGIAPNIEIDQGQIVSMTENVSTPEGEFKNVLKWKEATPLEPASWILILCCRNRTHSRWRPKARKAWVSCVDVNWFTNSEKNQIETFFIFFCFSICPTKQK